MVRNRHSTGGRLLHRHTRRAPHAQRAQVVAVAWQPGGHRFSPMLTHCNSEAGQRRTTDSGQATRWAQRATCTRHQAEQREAVVKRLPRWRVQQGHGGGLLLRARQEQVR